CADLRFRLFNSRQNVRISAATADVAAHPFANFVVVVRVPFLYARHCRANLPGRAVAALKSVLLDERGLHRMQLVAIRESFDRCIGLVDWSGTEKTWANRKRYTRSSDLFYKHPPRLWMTENPKFVQSVGIRLKRLLRFAGHRL